MQIREQIAQRKGWTVVAATTAVATIVGATGVSMATGSGSDGELRGGIELRDSARFTPTTELGTPDNGIRIMPFPIVGMDSGSFDSMASASAGAQGEATWSSSASFNSPPSPASPSSVNSPPSPDSPSSVDSPPSPASPPSVDSPPSASFDSIDSASWDSPSSVGSFNSPS